MRRTRAMAAFAAVAITAFVLSGLPVGATTAGETIEVYVEQLRVRGADVGPKGPSPGDDILVRAAVFSDVARTDRVGSVWAACETLSLNVIYCWNETRLAGQGVITTEGTQDFRADPPLFTNPVTGGTGDFATAAGEATIDFSTGLLVFELA